MFDFLEPIETVRISKDESYQEGQLGSAIYINEKGNVDWQDADIVIVGINENRGLGIGIKPESNATNTIREELYKLYHWHSSIKIADIGNVKIGKTIHDSYSAIASVICELIEAKKRIICIGGSHDTTLGVYYAFQKIKQQIEITCVDAVIDLSIESYKRSENFLLEMLTYENNYVRHYNHLAFQSYLAHPKMMATLDSLRFDCYRLGKLRQQMSLYEPIIRNSTFVSFDVNALQPSFMPCNSISPNGLAGDEACLITKYAGFSNNLQVMSVHGYENTNDKNQIGAKQIAQMIWYFVDGYSNLIDEKPISEKEAYNEFHTVFTNHKISFFQNRYNNKWWMELPDGAIVACTYEDYLTASHDEVPETWLRYQERFV